MYQFLWRAIAPLSFTVFVSTALAAPVAFPTDPFAIQVIQSLEFIDYPDVLLAVAVNNAQPWTRYDEGERAAGHGPLLPRWIQATTERAVSPDFEVELLRIHQIFQEIPDSAFRADPIGTSFRVLPIDDAGGDVGRDPRLEGFQPRPGFRLTADQAARLASLQQAVRSNPGFFDVVTPPELKELQSNRFLQVESHSVGEIMSLLGRSVLDPSGTPIPADRSLVRYKYPNAKRWREFTDLLSPGLQQQLAVAESQKLLEYNPFNLNAPFNPANPAQGGVSPVFKKLNQQLLHELLRKRFDPKDMGPNFFKNYQRMIAVHPFQDYNGRSLRALYRRMVGRPMFMVQFYHDLYGDQEMFGADVRAGDAGLDMIISAMAREQAAHTLRMRSDPRDMAKFYDLPEWWIFYAGPEDGRLLSAMPAILPRLVVEGKRWISQIPIEQRIDKKLFDGVVTDFRADLRQAGLLR